MEKKKNQKAEYQTTVGEDKKPLRLLLYVIMIVVIGVLGRTAYHFGYEVFCQEAMTSEIRAKEVEVTVWEGMSVYQIGKLLESKGLIKDPFIFTIQEKLSDYRGKIRTGHHVLSTAQTPDEMLAILTAEPEEEEP